MTIRSIQMIDSKIAFLISVAHGLDQAVYADAVTDFESAGLPVFIERREPEFFAALQYFGPTVLMVWLLKPYTDKFLGKLAEDNYESCKAGLKALWTKFAAKDRPLHWVITGTKGKVSEETLASEISFLARTSDEQAFRLLFPKDVSAETFETAVRNFYALIAQHDRDPKSSPLSDSPPFQFGGTRQRILTVVQAPERLVEVDVVGSSQTGTLVTVEITGRIP